MLASIARRTPSARSLVIADALALVAFVIVGSASHGQNSPVGPLLRTGAPLLVAWFAVAVALGTYPRGDVRASIVTWVVSVPAAAVIRSAVSDGPWDGSLIVFAGVSLAITAIFLVVGRVAVSAVSVRARRSRGTSE